MNPDFDFEAQLNFFHERLMAACSHIDVDNPDAAIGAIMWLLIDTLHMLPPGRQIMEITRLIALLNDVFAGGSDESEPAELPASLALN
jgi:hypothetical protein